MPLLLDKTIEKNTRLALWKTEEASHFFSDALQLTKKEVAEIELMRPHRKKEWLSSRFLLDYIASDRVRKQIVKSDLGKPSRKNCNIYISISHSKELTAVIQSDKKVGIDIQKKEDKISRISHKFISSSENSRIPKKKRKDYYHVFWGAKECMYKAYGLRELEFREHMHIYPFVGNNDGFSIKGYVQKENVFQDYDLQVEIIENAFLVYCKLNKEESR